MNKVTTINLGGNAYQLEEGGYEALRAYLETAAARLAGNPDRDEIISDIERAIADKFRALLATHKTVVEGEEIAAVLNELGSIEADSDAAEKSTAGSAGGAKVAQPAQPSKDSNAPRRLYRINEGAMIAGVCNGIGAYVNLDPTFVRIGFVFLTIFWGTGLLVYVVLAVVVPEARSPEEKSAASGIPATAQAFIRRAKEGYYKAMKNFPDSKMRRDWSRQFRRDKILMRWQFRRDMRLMRWHDWAAYAPAHPGASFALPLLSLLSGAGLVLFVCALFSVLATGAVFGEPLPAGLPVWGAAVLLSIIYGILMGPLKLARHACYCGGRSAGWSGSFFFLLDAAIWLGVVAVLACLAVHYLPEVRDAFHHLPSLTHQAVEDTRTWWNHK